MEWRREDGFWCCPLCIYRLESEAYDPSDFEEALTEHALAHEVAQEVAQVLAAPLQPDHKVIVARIESHRGLAIWLVNRAVARKPMIDREEATGDALLALVEASAKYDDSRGVHFTEYARPCIIGAILDGHYRRSRAIYTHRIGQPRARFYPEKTQPLESYKGVTTDPFREQVIDLLAALFSIPAHEARAVVSLAAGLTLRELAAAEERTIPTVAMRATRARAALAEMCR